MRKYKWKKISINWELYLLVALPLAFVIIFLYIPMYGNVIAFKRFLPGSGIWGSEWVGFENFNRFLTSFKFGRILRNTLVLNFYGLIAGFPAPIIFALFLNYLPFRGYKRSIQMVTYAPHFISTVVMVGIIYKLLTPRFGIINILFIRAGLTQQAFLSSAEWFPHVYVWTGIWQNMGWGSIIYLATLAAVDDSLHDTALVDGANIWQRIWHIDIPTILPIIVIILILNSGQMLNIGFEKIYLMQNNLNIRASEVISTYVYKIGLASAYPNYSYAAAIGLFQNIISFILLIIVNQIAKKLNHTSLW